MILTDGSLIRRTKDGSFHPLERGNVEIRYVCDSKGRTSISLMYDNMMIFADAKELTKLIRKE